MASHSRMLARNLLPSPSPFDAPATRPAISTNSTAVGTTFSGLTISASALRRASGTGTMPEFGSIVQNGKFSAAIPACVSALNKVDLPTLGRPTMPHLIPIHLFLFVSCDGLVRLLGIAVDAELARRSLWRRPGVELIHRNLYLAFDQQRQHRSSLFDLAGDGFALGAIEF